MKALLLAAGFGTRLRPITEKIPKCLVKIQGIPLLEIWLNKLFSNNIEEVIINTHYLGDKVIKFIERSKYKNKIIITTEEKLLGTAGTILENRKYLENGPFFVIHSDNLSNFSFKSFIEAHQNRPKRCNITMMTFISQDPKNCGILKLSDDKVVTAFYEKIKDPPSNLANAAIYIMEISIFNEINESTRDISLDLIPKKIDEIYTYHNNIYHRDIGDIKSLRTANLDYKFSY